MALVPAGHWTTPSPLVYLESFRKKQRVQPAARQMATSYFPLKLSEAMLVLCVLIVGVSAFTPPPKEHTETASNCSFLGKEYKAEFRLVGEPVVLTCPLIWSLTLAGASVSPQHPFTWYKNGSAQLISEEPRMQLRESALWILQAMREDSGTYICRVSNATHCDEMSIELKVFTEAEAPLSLITYLQTLFLGDDGMLMCPDTHDFAQDQASPSIRWYKGSVLLGEDGGRFRNVEELRRLLIVSPSLEDEGLYKCILTFVHEGRRYNVTRQVRLRIREITDTVPVLISPLDTISASLGSRLTIPCKVSLGTGTPMNTLLWWMANITELESAYPQGRVREGPRREYSENGENFIEVPLNFDPVIREDLNTEFRCTVSNSQGFETLQTTVKEAHSTFSWGVALAPLSLIFLVLGGICIHKQWKRRARKGYGLPMLKTGSQDFCSLQGK
ncbi:interleukin-1 receptor type 2 isoform X4 [Cavia porcellus]|uniref:interleukin-1 receptor type 2 isoform X4 n=1 Tax=Cavia porcellus TaxID=10141 RepID=UPI0006618EC7|nr:interleukin-1 receptor type 2 isoform X3 [Cavia porcellus]